MRRLTRSLPLVALAAAMLSSSVVGCRPRNQFAPPPPPTVTVKKPVEKAVAETLQFTGTTRAVESIELRARVNGYLDKIAVQDGAFVKQGDLLFVIQQAPFQVELQSAQATLQKAQAELQLADANLARSTKLFGQNAITEQQMDIQKAERSRALAEVASAEALVHQAELNLAFTEIRAPIDGKLGRHLVDAGNVVKSEETALAKIERIDPIHAYFYVSERDLLRFMELRRKGAIPNPEETPPELQLGLSNEPDFPHKGQVDYLEWGVDPGTGTLMRRGTFPNSDFSLISGMFVRIRAQLGEPIPRLLVEERALGADQRGDYLLVVNKDKIVEYRPVKLGIAVNGMRVIDEGIGPEDWVIVNGLQRARPGAPVDPKIEEPATVNADPAKGAPAKEAIAESKKPGEPG